MRKPMRIAGAVGIGLLVSVIGIGVVTAADHVEAPGVQGNPAVDITDFYAWHTDDGKIVAVIGFAGLGEAGAQATYDDTVLYGIHIDNSNDNVADEDIWIRFGKNAADEWGVKVMGIAADPVIGPVGTIIDAPLGLRVYAGLRDDPFFFDLEGYNETLDTATLAFDNSRDFFAQTNVTAIVVELSVDAVAAGQDNITMWATTRQ